ncbi:MAG: hypothetical protein WCZ01_05240 [Candidatus Neomarinimicrobiota bacterium]
MAQSDIPSVILSSSLLVILSLSKDDISISLFQFLSVSLSLFIT